MCRHVCAVRAPRRVRLHACLISWDEGILGVFSVLGGHTFRLVTHMHLPQLQDLLVSHFLRYLSSPGLKGSVGVFLFEGARGGGEGGYTFRLVTHMHLSQLQNLLVSQVK
jgi:hypothetical protein